MLLQVLLLILGLVVLYFGAEAMVKGACQLALAFGISPFIVGLTVVAFGTSAPEFLVSFIATWNGSEGISVGNIIGSNICNLTLILGTASLIAPMSIDKGALGREYPIMLISSGLFFVLALTGVGDQAYAMERWEGAILFVGIVAFVAYNVRLSFKPRRAEAPPIGEEVEADDDVKSTKAIARNIAYVVLGLAGLAGGAHLMVTSAEEIARHFGVSEIVIGTTVLAFGTSLPELATSVVASLRGQSDLSVGNIFGSNIFNVMFIMGTVPMIFGMPVEPSAITFHFPIMLAITLLVFPMMRTKWKLSRVEGGILLAIYLGYVVSLFMGMG